jgi:hypothetical protein
VRERFVGPGAGLRLRRKAGLPVDDRRQDRRPVDAPEETLRLGRGVLRGVAEIGFNTHQVGSRDVEPAQHLFVGDARLLVEVDAGGVDMPVGRSGAVDAGRSTVPTPRTLDPGAPAVQRAGHRSR